MKIERIPRGWGKIQRQSALGVIKIEFSNLNDMRSNIDREIEILDAQLSRTDDDSQRALLIKASADRVAEIVESHVMTMRHEARLLAVESLEDEIEELGLIEDIGSPEASTSRIDRAAASAAGLSYAGAWSAAAMSAVFSAGDGEKPQVRRLLEAQDYRLKRIATSETIRAFNDEHANGLEAIEEAHKEKQWFPFVVRRWDAILDRKTCEVCRSHDGEYTVVGMDFDNGDEPGFVHPGCRCLSTLVPLPAFYNTEAA